ncbi:unnamed protein product, partial [Ectocarpus sp. 12 AP-2014]
TINPRGSRHQGLPKSLLVLLFGICSPSLSPWYSNGRVVRTLHGSQVCGLLAASSLTTTIDSLLASHSSNHCTQVKQSNLENRTRTAGSLFSLPSSTKSRKAHPDKRTAETRV